MASIINASLNLDKITKDKIFQGKNGRYVTLTFALNEETRYGNNVSVWESLTKEEREGGAEKNYIGNGKVVWTDGQITLAVREEETAGTQPQTTTNDFPF